MRQGAYFKEHGHVIICDHESNDYYIYGLGNDELHMARTYDEAKTWIIKKMAADYVEPIKHEGVELIEYSFNDMVYIISVKNEIFKEIPKFRSKNYYELIWNNNSWLKYLHNEKGPSNININTGQNVYFWHGEQVTLDQWKKAVHENKFDKKLDDWINSD